MKINLSNLAHQDRSLYARLIRAVSVNIEREGTTHFGYFREADLDSAPGVKIDLLSWLKRQESPAPTPAPTPPAPEPEPTPEAVEEEPQISMEEIEAENRADIQRRMEQRRREIAAEEAQAVQAAQAATQAVADAAADAAIPRLPNGEEQLPLDAIPSHKHSVAQLKDLAQRQREAARSEPRAHGWRGAKL